MRQKIAALFLIAAVAVGALPAALAGGGQTEREPGPEVTAAAETPYIDPVDTALAELRALDFTDLPAGDPRRDAVCYTASQYILLGNGDGSFAPEGLVTRAAAVTALMRLSGEEPPAYAGAFSDVAAGSWYAPAAAWALDAGLTDGGMFEPDRRVTREELAVLLYRCAGHLGYDTATKGSLAGYRDGGAVSPEAETAVAWALRTGVFASLVSNTIHPELAVCRGQLAQVLVSFVSHGTGDALARRIAGAFYHPAPPSASRTRHAELQAAVEAAADKYGAIGLQVAVVEDGTVTDTFSCGWATRSQYAVVDSDGTALSWEGGEAMTADHKERAASLSKVAVGLAAMLLREEGTVDLDEGIGTYWGCKVQNPYYPDSPVTLRALLSHTSSIFLAGDGVSREYASVRAKLAGPGFTRTKPGALTSWGYNNYGFAVLGMTLELAAGESLDQVLGEALFAPMGIDAAFESGSVQDTDALVTLYDHAGRVERSVAAQKKLCRSGAPGSTGRYFAGGLTISAADLAKLTALLANDGRYEGLQLLAPESVALMEACPEQTVSDGFYQALPLRCRNHIYGRDTLYYHTGSAYGVYNCLSYDPATGDGVVVLTTGASGAKDGYGIYAVCGEIMEQVYAAIQ